VGYANVQVIGAEMVDFVQRKLDDPKTLRLEIHRLQISATTEEQDPN